MDQPLAATESLEPIHVLPFDDPIRFPSFWGRVIRTIGVFLRNPVEAIRQMTLVSEGPGSLSFFMAIAWPLNAVDELLRYLSQHVTWPWVHHLYPRVIPEMTLWNLALSTLLAPIGLAISFWILSYVVHGLLWVWRGLSLGYGKDTTERALGFTLGITTLLGFGIQHLTALAPLHVPMNLDRWAYGGACIWFTGYALAKAHRTDLFRGFGAMVTPVVLVTAAVYLLGHASR